MLFNSFEFLLFFPFVVGLYFILPHRFRWAFLLAASYYFYMCWKAEYLVLIVLSTVVDYYASIQMNKFSEKQKRKPFLYLSLVVNLGVLFGFKYFNFFSESANTVFNQLNIFYDVPTFDILLPVGISFYTFQTLSYTIDVYRGRLNPERHFGMFALYVSFWPQLVAGPIERPQNLLPQFYKKKSFNYENVTSGLKLMAWGYFKKMVIADRLASLVDPVFNNPQWHDGLTHMFATVAFAFQIFCDFSGYSDIAIGAALVMGFKLMKNFDSPYWSRSIGQFWRKWHISLSTWFRDYVYIPLGGNRVVKWRWYYNLFITFTISGLWHGANWTFVAWGAFHGLLLVLENMTANFRDRFSSIHSNIVLRYFKSSIQVFVTFVLVCIGWVFFRANTIDDAFLILHRMSNPDLKLDMDFLSAHTAKFAVLAVIVMMGIQLVRELSGKSIRDLVSKQHVLIRWPLYISLILVILFFGTFHSQSEFIYFQF